MCFFQNLLVQQFQYFEEKKRLLITYRFFFFGGGDITKHFIIKKLVFLKSCLEKSYSWKRNIEQYSVNLAQNV